MFDDDACRLRESLDAFPRRIRIGDVVVGQFLALQLPVIAECARYGTQVAIKRCLLVWIFAVTQILELGEAHVDLFGECAGSAVDVGGRQIITDCAIIGGSVRKGFPRQAETRLDADRAIGGLHLGDQRGIVGRIRDDGHILPVFRRRAHHRRAADVDVLDSLFQRASGLCYGLRERIKIDDHEVDDRNVGMRHGLHVLGQVAARKNAGVHFRMQGLHAAVEHFRKAGVVADFDDRHICFAQQFGGAACRQDVDAECVHGAGEFHRTGFIGQADQGFALVHRDRVYRTRSKNKPPVGNERAAVSGASKPYLMP